MKLRYLSLQDAPPLDKLAIPFWQETVLGRACAIRFVVGVNGSGKSRLLQALTQLFLILEQYPNTQLPFNVTLVYDLGSGGEKQTIFLNHQVQAGKTQFEWTAYEWITDIETHNWQNEDWQNLPTLIDNKKVIRNYDDSSGSNTEFLPSALIAYTSGGTANWKAIFTDTPNHFEIPELETIEERPLVWDVEAERQYLRVQGLNQAADDLTAVELETSNTTQQIGYFIDRQQLQSVICAVVLRQTATDFHAMSNKAEENILLKKWEEDIAEERVKSGFRHLLNEIGWLYPVTIGFKINFEPDNWIGSDKLILKKLFGAASRIVTEPEPSTERTLFFDVKNKEGDTLVVDALIQVFAEAEKTEITPFDIFKQLYRWRQLGILTNIVMAIKKRGVEDLILYDWLSDGEQLFIGRMALFHLMEGESDILALLDEPETHFNDVWKRRIVDVIDDSLQDMNNEIVITTHSSVALTDVFRVEVTRLEMLMNEGSISYRPNRVNTFGASPNIIMQDIFGAPESVGQRAMEFLDLILLLASHREEVHSIWNNDLDTKDLQQSLAIQKLVLHVKTAQATKELPHDYGDDSELAAYLVKILRSVKSHVQKISGEEAITVVLALKTLRDYIGEGFYQFEFRRRLRALEKLEQ
ncbi:MAG: AAA family ATPase [Saprospiraceae bacterium]